MQQFGSATFHFFAPAVVIRVPELLHCHHVGAGIQEVGDEGAPEVVRGE